MKKTVVFLLISLLYFYSFSCSKVSKPSLKKGQGTASTRDRGDIFSFLRGSSNKKSVSRRRGRINIERWINDNFLLAVGAGAVIILVGYVIYQNRRGARRRV